MLTVELQKLIQGCGDWSGLFYFNPVGLGYVVEREWTTVCQKPKVSSFIEVSEFIKIFIKTSISSFLINFLVVVLECLGL